MGYKLGSNRNNNSFTSFQNKGLVNKPCPNPPCDDILPLGDSNSFEKYNPQIIKAPLDMSKPKSKEDIKEINLMNKIISSKNTPVTKSDLQKKRLIEDEQRRRKNAGGIEMVSAPHEWFLGGGVFKSALGKASFNLSKSSVSVYKSAVNNFTTGYVKPNTAGVFGELVLSLEKNIKEQK